MVFTYTLELGSDHKQKTKNGAHIVRRLSYLVAPTGIEPVTSGL